MKHFCAILIVIFALLSGCISTNLPSVCDSTTDSYLCEAANQLGIRLETVGLLLVVVSTKAINDGYVSTNDAELIIISILSILEEPITYVLFKDKLLEYETQYPILITISKEYIKLFSVDKYITPNDKSILKSWLNDQLVKL